MFGKKSATLLTYQSNLHPFQKDSSKSASTSETETEHFIGILLMTGICCFLEQHYIWISNTRIECISSVMSSDPLLEIKKHLHVADNSVQPNRTNINFDHAPKIHPLLNIVKENFGAISREEKLSVDKQIIPVKGKSIMKQYMPNKPNRWDYKMLVSFSDICYDFIFYTSKSDQRKHGFCIDIVLDLSETRVTL